ncbi:hypothetical protein [Sulfurospirillum multivorans]|uniref:Uncharacterized protein n=2 Tax=Sulfurospirillum multivorans TaxID=66821 RepID=A0AA86AQ19_SULMK|nr:hypothetical protein [Sulfurospirillum multivorans]AHJ14359.1 hypothetical protein SMUL_3133 [Sulfurospirillum multivorans DSM 12446]QEH07844.1 hypothetical protein SMN_3095 [Sulfurospirillum multivorans]
MAESHVISALVLKRSEFLGEIQHYEALIKEYKENLVSIDKTIHIFDASYDLRTIKSKRVMKERYFQIGEAVVLILDTLRTSNKPMKTDEICAAIASKKGLSLESDYEKATFQKTIVASLSRTVNNNLVERAGRDGLTMIWQIKAVI